MHIRRSESIVLELNSPYVVLHNASLTASLRFCFGYLCDVSDSSRLHMLFEDAVKQRH